MRKVDIRNNYIIVRIKMIVTKGNIKAATCTYMHTSAHNYIICTYTYTSPSEAKFLTAKHAWHLTCEIQFRQCYGVSETTTDLLRL